MTLSRRTYVEGKRYETVLFQENTHPGDFEMVEFQDALNREREALGENLIDDGFFGDSFKVVGAGLTNAVNVTSGPGGYSTGRRIILPDLIHPLIGGVYIYNMAISTPAVNRTDLVYLDIFLDTVDSTMDPDIQDPVLGPSASRERLRYVFSLVQGATNTNVPTLPVGHVGLPLAMVTRRAGDPLIQAADIQDVRPIAALNAQFKPKNTIIVSPLGGDFSDPAAALNSVAGLASASNPYTIVIMPGVYTIMEVLDFNTPYVSMIGVSPDVCTIQGDFSGLAVAEISASNILIKNLTLDYVSGSGSHSATIYSNGAHTATFENLVLAPFYYAENTTNAFYGIDTLAGGIFRVKDCVIYAQSSSPSAAVSVGGSGAVNMTDCQIVSANMDCVMVASGATLSMRACSFIGSKRQLVSAGAVVARDCTWTMQTLKTFVPSSVRGLDLTGGSCVLSDCSVISSPGSTNNSIVSTSATFTNVVLDYKMETSGGGTSVYTNVTFYGLDLNGTLASFFGCTFQGANSSWGFAGTNNDALLLRGSNAAMIRDCYFNSRGVFIDGGSPMFSGCHFMTSTGAPVIKSMSSATNIIVDSCTFILQASYSLGTVIGSGAGGGTARFTLTHCHFEGQAGGFPQYIIGPTSGGGIGAALFLGGITGPVGTTLRDPAATSYNNIAMTP